MKRQTLLIALTTFAIVGSVAAEETKGLIQVYPGWAGYPGLESWSSSNYRDSPGTAGTYGRSRCTWGSDEAYARASVSSTCSGSTVVFMSVYVRSDINNIRLDTGGTAVSYVSGRTIWEGSGFADCTGYAWQTADPTTDTCT
jgi:hypothetical protein